MPAKNKNDHIDESTEVGDLNLNGGAGDDTIFAGTGDDQLSGGSGNDSMDGGAGDDHLVGGSGEDTLSGGGGDDLVSGDSGDDILVYNVNDNDGYSDTYDGGSGIDALHLMMTEDRWLDPAFQADLAAYLTFLNDHELPNGQVSNAEFQFTAFDLNVSKIENLRIFIDNGDGTFDELDPANDPVNASDDENSIFEDQANPLTGEWLLNDDVDDLVASVSIVPGSEPNYGTATISNSGTYSYSLDNADPAIQALAQDDVLIDSFTYIVTDADGNADTATVSITIQGTNDAPVLVNFGAPALVTISEDIADAANTGALVSDLVGTSITDVDNGAVEGIAITSLDSTNGTWQYQLASSGGWVNAPTVSAGAALLLGTVDSLRFVPNADYSGTASLTYQAWDQTSGTAGSTADASINGGTTSFSTASESATIDVIPVADTPTLTVDGPAPGTGSITLFDEITVNEEVQGNQSGSQVTELSDGRVLFTWFSFDPDVDGSAAGISARIGTVQSDGSIAWDSAGEITINEEVQSNQTVPQVTELSDGRVLFTWRSSDLDVDGDSSGIAARVGTVQSDGSIAWDSADEITVNQEVQSFVGSPQVTQLGDGRVLLTWASNDPDVDGDNYGISARIGMVQSDGSIAWDSAGEITVNEEVQGRQSGSQVTDLSDGRVLFTWDSLDPDVDDDNSGISARIGTVQSDGSIAWDSAGEITVNEEVDGTQFRSQVTDLSDGRLLFTWQSADPDVDGDSYGISARIGTVQSDGSIVWGSAGEVTVNEEVQNVQASTQITQLSDGRVLFTWQSRDPDVDGDSSGIAARIGMVQSDGSIAWDGTGEITINEEVQSIQETPKVTQLSDGRVVFTWFSLDPDVDADATGISARILDLGLGIPEDTPIDINITAAVTDADGSETLVLKLTDFPPGAMFSLGALVGSEWVIDDAAEIALLATTPLTMTPPENFSGTFTLAVEVVVTDTASLSTGGASDTTSVTEAIDITVTPTASGAPDIDVLVANQNQTNQFLTNDGSGNFTASDLDGGDRFSNSVALGDVDGAGDLDALIGNLIEPNQLLINDGSGNFTASDVAGGARASSDVALGDLDGDGSVAPIDDNGLPNINPDGLLPVTDDGFLLA